MVFDNLHYSCSAEASQRLGVPVLAALLRNIEGVAHVILARLRELAQVLKT